MALGQHQTDAELGHRPDQIVVALAHAGVVLAELRSLGLEPVERDASADLGLALFGVAPDRIAAALELGGTDGALEELLRRLYGAFEERFHGWAPTIGKNRVLERVSGAHRIDIGGGDGSPRAVVGDGRGKRQLTAADGPLPARSAEPGFGVRVGLLDTKLYAHEWLAGACQAAPSALLREDGWADSMDRHFAAGHATFAAGVVLQQAPGATLDVRAVLGDEGTADSWDVAKAVVLFARSGIDVLNLSFGCFTDDNTAPLVLSTAIDRIDPDIVVVAAAGNHGAHADSEQRNRPLFPAALDDVLAVGATGPDGYRAAFSPDPEWAPWVDVAAPGVDVVSTYLGPQFPVELTDADGKEVEQAFDGYARWSGTSFAAARVSGAIASRVRPGRTSAAAALADMSHRATVRDGLPWLAPPPDSGRPAKSAT